MSEFRSWLRSSAAYDVLDDAVLGCLLEAAVDEICEDFGVSRQVFRAELAAALEEGN